MKPQKSGNFPRPGPEVVKRQRVAQERAAQNVISWTVQNEMRGVLGRVSASATGRTLDSANPQEIELNRRLCRYSVDEREHSERDEGAQVPR